jgi:hypothetical protein
VINIKKNSLRWPHNIIPQVLACQVLGIINLYIETDHICTVVKCDYKSLINSLGLRI